MRAYFVVKGNDLTPPPPVVKTTIIKNLRVMSCP